MADTKTISAADTALESPRPELSDTDVAAAQEFNQIKQFVAACRRQWTGAIIVLRPDGAPTGVNAPPNLKPEPGEST